MREEWLGLAKALDKAQKEIERLNGKLGDQIKQNKRWKNHLAYLHAIHSKKINEIMEDHDNELHCIGIQLACRGLSLVADKYTRQFKVLDEEKLPRHPNVNLTIYTIKNHG